MEEQLQNYEDMRIKEEQIWQETQQLKSAIEEKNKVIFDTSIEIESLQVALTEKDRVIEASNAENKALSEQVAKWRLQANDAQ